MTEQEEKLSYIIGITSFILGLMNYEQNLSQSDKQEIIDRAAQVSDIVIRNIDQHLQIQDQKIDKILKLLDNKGKSLDL